MKRIFNIVKKCSLLLAIAGVVLLYSGYHVIGFALGFFGSIIYLVNRINKRSDNNTTSTTTYGYMGDCWSDS